MPRSPRHDGADTWHHLTNRGIARRPVFETRSDVRHFLSLVARTARRGLIEVHAYCIMTTHFHLLVRSPQGRLSEAMQWIEDVYTRRYNRVRRRDGAIFRGRFQSVPVLSNVHWTATLVYLDRNPLEAHVVAAPSDYPWCSAWQYARRRVGPRWLCRSRVEALLADRSGPGADAARGYDAVIDAAASPGVSEWVERTLRRRGRVEPDLDDLVGAAPDRVRAWMERKSRLADGRPARTLVVSVRSVRRAVDAASIVRPDWDVRIGRRRRCAWEAMRVGLLRGLAAATLSDVASWEGASDSAVRRRERWHLEAMRMDPEYAATAARIIADALRDGESVEKVSDTVPTLCYFAR